MTVQRESAIKKLQKAPTKDPVEALAPQPAADSRAAKPDPVAASIPAESSHQLQRGPGRPRGRKRSEPLSTNIEMDLRDRVDDYCYRNNMTLVQFLDEAFRLKLSTAASGEENKDQ